MDDAPAFELNRSGRQIAQLNLERFKQWIVERETAADWIDYVRGEKLNRTEIAVECGFAKSVLQQNPSVKAELDLLEVRLRLSGAFGTPSEPRTSTGAGSAACFGGYRPDDVAAAQTSVRRALAAKAKAESRVKSLEEQNGTLRAEIRDLRDRLSKLDMLDDHLGRTGRLLTP